MRALLVAMAIVPCGCVASSQRSDDLARTRATVTFRTEESPDLTGFTRHGSVGLQSAWYNASINEVLVLRPMPAGALRIAGFPRGFGRVVATGWEDGKRFFVHVSPGADTGTMIYIDLLKNEVKEVRPWGAW